MVNAAVAVLIRNQSVGEPAEVLLAQRPEGKPWAGWWEFPGGKVEEGEDIFFALQRELQEELGIQAVNAYPWITRTFAYPEKTVKLHFYMVRDWQGEPYGREGQLLSWQNPAALTVSPMLPANEPILAALDLAPVYAITNLEEAGLKEVGETVFFSQLESKLASGLRMIQVREKQLSATELKAFLDRVIAMARPYGTKVLLNGDVELASVSGADGVHLSSAQLMKLQQKPEGLMCGASCHSVDELMHAQQLALDFAMLSPVLPTKSHPGGEVLGWQRFRQMIKDCAIPVYALGGLSPSDLIQAWQYGAHGIAMQRAVWE